MSELLAGRIYFNIHDSLFRGGEIRGQLVSQGASTDVSTVSTTTEGAGNEVQSLSIGGTGAGSFMLSLGGVSGSTPVIATPPVNEVQRLDFSGPGSVSASTSQFQLGFNGSFGTQATQLTYVAGVSPTHDDIVAHLNTIPGLFDPAKGISNFLVAGNDGGPFTITFLNQQAAQNVSQLVPFENGTTLSGAVITTTTEGALRSLGGPGADARELDAGRDGHPRRDRDRHRRQRRSVYDRVQRVAGRL